MNKEDEKEEFVLRCIYLKSIIDECFNETSNRVKVSVLLLKISEILNTEENKEKALNQVIETLKAMK